MNFKMNSLLLSIIILISFINFQNAYDLDEKIEVYYLIAPLMESKYGYLLANFNAFHAGLGFVTLKSNEKFTVDFYASPTIMASFFPTVDNSSSADSISSMSSQDSLTGGSYSMGGNSYNLEEEETAKSSSSSSSSNGPLPELIWNTKGIVQYQELIDDSYWTGRTLMFTITGAQFQEYLCWLPVYNYTYPYYSLFDVTANDNDQIVYYDSSTCFDFVWSSFDILKSLGGVLATQTAPSRNFVTLRVSQVPNLVYHPKLRRNWKQITDFYSKISYNPDQPITEFIGNLSILLNGTAFLHINGSYYNLTISPTNPISITYLPQSLPTSSISPELLGVPGTCLIPKKKSIGGGWIFIIILFSSIILYISLGLILNKFLFKKEEIFPNKYFWIGFGGLIADGFRFIKFKITGKRGGYTSTGNEHDFLL